MKNLKIVLSLLLFVGFATLSFAQGDNSLSGEGPIMTFESMIVDYGEIEQNSDPLRVVTFTNTGSEPLVISNARGSCGCTVPTWPKQPVMPGETGTIEIRYDTKRLGGINKTVTITTNDGGDAHILKVIGQIREAAVEDGVPANTGGLIKPN